MKTIFATTALASFMVVGGLFASLPATAQDNQPCMGENCPTPDMPTGKKMKGVDQNNQDTDQPGDQTLKRKKQMQGSSDQNGAEDQVLPRKKRAQNNNNNDVDVDVDVNVGSQQRVRHADWRFDSSRHQRRRSKSATFRFYLNGYYYDQPYWEVYSVRRGRVSCGEGRAIVSERFNRVRVVECNGGTYTYLGRRQGDTYRIILNARTGRIVGRALI
jgi:hypothetical protein